MTQFAPRKVGYRICRKCGFSRPLAEMSAVNKRVCQKCVDERVPSLTAKQRNRASRRAMTKLAQLHKEDYTRLYQKECELMRNENGIAEIMGGLR